MGSVCESKENEKIESKNTDVAPEKNLYCNINKNSGMCVSHGILTKKVEVTSKVWKKINNVKGYGWSYKKVNKFICRARNMTPSASDISTERNDLSHVANGVQKISESQIGQGTSDG